MKVLSMHTRVKKSAAMRIESAPTCLKERVSFPIFIGAKGILVGSPHAIDRISITRTAVINPSRTSGMA